MLKQSDVFTDQSKLLWRIYKNCSMDSLCVVDFFLFCVEEGRFSKSRYFDWILLDLRLIVGKPCMIIHNNLKKIKHCWWSWVKGNLWWIVISYVFKQYHIVIIRLKYHTLFMFSAHMSLHFFMEDTSEYVSWQMIKFKLWFIILRN